MRVACDGLGLGTHVYALLEIQFVGAGCPFLRTCDTPSGSSMTPPAAATKWHGQDRLGHACLKAQTTVAEASHGDESSRPASLTTGSHAVLHLCCPAGVPHPNEYGIEMSVSCHAETSHGKQLSLEHTARVSVVVTKQSVFVPRKCWQLLHSSTLLCRPAEPQQEAPLLLTP